MQACMYFNLVTGAVFVGLSSFAACGGGQPPPATPTETASTAAPAEASAAPASTAATASAPSSSGASLAAAPATAAPPAPDRSMNDIRAVVAGNREAFRACYDKSLKAHP